MKIAIMGFGVVGQGAYRISEITSDIEVKRILVRRPKPGFEDIADKFTTDISDIVNDDEIELVIESIGGVDTPREYVLACMNAGKHIVTPNKSLVCAGYDELMNCAYDNNVELRFTSSAGGGIPWLFNLKRTQRCDFIQSVSGIVNGTSNYILDSMHKNGASFEEVLRKAQELGYAESDPSADIEGTDTLRKAVISAKTAFSIYGCNFDQTDVPCYGIDTIDACDIAYFNEHGYTCKLMMCSKLNLPKLAIYVEPTLFPSTSLEANVTANNNLITLVGESIGKQSFFGQGAGSLPTGESVIQDVIDIKDNIRMQPPVACGTALEVDNSELHTYYVRYNHLCLDIEPIIESFEEKDGIFYGITKPISVKRMSELGNYNKQKQRKMFYACISE